MPFQYVVSPYGNTGANIDKNNESQNSDSQNYGIAQRPAAPFFRCWHLQERQKYGIFASKPEIAYL